MSKMNKILAVLLVFQLALVAYFYRPGQASAPPKVQFFSDVQPGQVVGLTIADSKESVTINKKDGHWLIDSAAVYPADKGKVERLVDKLCGLTSSRLVTRTAASHRRLKVADDDCNRKITLNVQDGSTRVLLLGSSPTYKTCHVRQGKSDEVYLVRNFADWEAQPEVRSWWDANYIDVKPAELKRVVLTNSHGRIELNRGADKKWQTDAAGKDEVLADHALDDFLNRVSLIQLSSYLDRDKDAREYGLDKPAAELELNGLGGPVDLKVVAKDKKGEEYVMKASDSPYYVQASSYQVKGLIDSTLADLLKPRKAQEPKPQKTAAKQ